MSQNYSNNKNVELKIRCLKQYLGGNSDKHRTKSFPAETACAAAYKVYSKSPLNTYFQHTFLIAILLLFFLLCTAANTFAKGRKEKDSPKLQKVEVSGRVRMVGNSPMTALVISGENREWYIEPEEQEKLMDFQQQTVTVRADEYYYDRVFANGASAGRQYYIKNIVIIEPKNYRQ